LDPLRRSIVGIYDGFLDKLPIGPAMNRGIKFRMAQTPVQRYPRGEIDASFVITRYWIFFLC